MARINVSKKALTDPRFRILGNRLSPLNLASKSDVEQAFGLFLALKVWDYAQERGTDVLPGTFIEGIYDGLTEAMIDAELLEAVDERMVRVRGWVESDGGWLERQRVTSRAGGIARAAGSQRGPDGTFLPASSSQPPADLAQVSPGVPSAPTPTPTPTPTQKKKNTPKPPRAARSYAPGFLRAWDRYPHWEDRSVKAKAFDVWGRQQLEPLTDNVLSWIERGRESRDWRKNSGEFVTGFQVWLRDRDFSGPWTEPAPGAVIGRHAHIAPPPVEEPSDWTKAYWEAKRSGKTEYEARIEAKRAAERARGDAE